MSWGGTLIGSPTAAVQFVSRSATASTWQVVGSATYAEKGTYTVAVTVNDVDGSSVATSKTTINVADAALTDATPTTTLSAIEGNSTGTVILATFTDADPSAPATDFTPSVNWGGTLIGAGTSSVQLVSRSATASTWQVVGSATYAADGTHTVSVTVNDIDGNSVSTNNTRFNVTDDVRVLLLDPSGTGALTATGNGSVIVGGTGVITVASTDSAAVTVAGKGNVSAAELDLVSASGTRVSGSGIIKGEIEAGVAPAEAADPLASLAAPAAPTTTFAAVNYSGSAALTLQPGTYVGGIHVSGNATVTLAAGIYYLKGGGFSVSGEGSVIGDGVLLYNAQQTSGDVISLSGNGSVILTAATSGTYQGIVVFQARGSAVPISVSGNGGLNLTGTLYAAGATVNLSGNGPLALQGTSGRLICADLKISGNGSLTANIAKSGSSGTQKLSTADGASDTSASAVLADATHSLAVGMLTVAIDGLSGDSAGDEEARIADAIATIDIEMAPFGVSLVEVVGDAASSANIHIHLADTSPIGGVAQGVLGVTVGGNDITLIAGWDWYTAADASLIGASQYDFQTVVTHELGHAVSLGHSADTGSVMYPTLAQGAARHDLTAADQTVIETAVDSQPEPLLAAPAAGRVETVGGDGPVAETKNGTVQSAANGYTLFTPGGTSPQETNSPVGMFAPSNQFGAVGEGRNTAIQVGNILRLPASGDVGAGGDNDGTGLIANWTWGDQWNPRRVAPIALAIGPDSRLDAMANGNDSAADGLSGGLATDRFFRFKTLDKLSG